ncbi:hypothetical protein D3C84_1049920 [compost metagenome]
MTENNSGGSVKQAYEVFRRRVMISLGLGFLYATSIPMDGADNGNPALLGWPIGDFAGEFRDK